MGFPPQKYPDMSTILNSVVTKEIVTTRDVDDPTFDTLLIDAPSNIDIRLEDSDVLTMSLRDSDNTFMMEATDLRSIYLKPTDALTSLQLGNVHISSYVDKEVITSVNEKQIEVDAPLLHVTGSQIVGNNLLTRGSIFTPDINFSSDISGSDYGFGIRINDDNDSLEMYKYDKNSGITKPITVFGKGAVIGSSTTNARSEFDVGYQSQSQSQSTTLYERLWSISDSHSNNIYVPNGNVGIGLDDPASTLHVKGSVTFESEESEVKVKVDSSGVQVGSVNSSIIPSLSNFYTLGTEEMPWKHLYLGNNSLTIGSCVISENDGNLKIDNIITTKNLNAPRLDDYDLKLRDIEDRLMARGDRGGDGGLLLEDDVGAMRSRLEILELGLKSVELGLNACGGAVAVDYRDVLEEMRMEIDICKRDMDNGERKSYEIMKGVGVVSGVDLSGGWLPFAVDGGGMGMIGDRIVEKDEYISEIVYPNPGIVMKKNDVWMDVYITLRFTGSGCMGFRMRGHSREGDGEIEYDGSGGDIAYEYYPMVNGQIRYDSGSDVVDTMTVHIPVHANTNAGDSVMFLEMKSRESVGIEILKVQVVL